MESSFVLLCVTLTLSVTSAAAQPGVIESLLSAAQQRPWLWGLYVFIVGLPAVLFVSFMWPDKRFGPPDQDYYYKKSDDVQPDDPEFSPKTKAAGPKVKSERRRKDAKTRKSDLELKDSR